MAQENADVARLIEAFGGLRPMAAALGASVSTVQGWKERGRIPPARAPKVREAAARQSVEPGLVEAALAASGSASRGGRGGRGPGRKAAAPGAIQVPATPAAPAASSATPASAAPPSPASPPAPASRPLGPEAQQRARRWITFAAALVLVAAIVWTWADVFADYRIGWEPPTQAPAPAGSTASEEAARPLPFLRPRNESETASEAAPLAAGEAGDRLAVQTVALAETREQVGALAARVQLLEEESEALAGALREARRDVSERAARLDEIERLARTPPSPAAAAALALLQLEALVLSGAPYREALDVAAHLAPAQAGLLTAALGSRADEGLPTRPALLAEFRLLRPRAERAWLAERPWWLKALAALPGGLAISREAAPPDAPAPAPALGGEAGANGAREGALALAARAEAALRAGRLAEAAVAVEAMTGGAGAALAPWSERARARLAAEAALARAASASVRALAESVEARSNNAPQ